MVKVGNLELMQLYTLSTSIYFFFTVCISFMGRLYQSLKDDDIKFTSADIEKALVKKCKDAKGKENRLVSARSVSFLLIFKYVSLAVG